MSFYAYMLLCCDGSYYVGHTDNLEYRLACHERGEIAGYTQSRRPVELVWCEIFPTREEALANERRIKGWNRQKKQALIAEDWERIIELAHHHGPLHKDGSAP